MRPTDADPGLVVGLRTPERLEAVLALNDANAIETSPLDAPGLARLLDRTFRAAGIWSGGRLEAFMVALDEDAAYDSPNFFWFKARYPAFVSVDRIVTAAHARGRGHGRRLYADLFAAAREAGHTHVVCEVNRMPPNPGSDAFHAALGFRPVGDGTLPGSKVVRYLEARVDAWPG